MPTLGVGAQKSRARSDGDALLDRFQMKRTNHYIGAFEIRPENPFSISDRNVHGSMSICAKLEKGIATFGHCRDATKPKLVSIDTNIGVWKLPVSRHLGHEQVFEGCTCIDSPSSSESMT